MQSRRHFFRSLTKVFTKFAISPPPDRGRPVRRHRRVVRPRQPQREAVRADRQKGSKMQIGTKRLSVTGTNVVIFKNICAKLFGELICVCCSKRCRFSNYYFLNDSFLAKIVRGCGDFSPKIGVFHSKYSQSYRKSNYTIGSKMGKIAKNGEQVFI
jgi:hypothetical protein